MGSMSFNHFAVFYQKHERKIITLVTALLVIYLAAFAAKLTWRLFPTNESDTQNRVATKIQVNNAQSTQSRIDIDSLLNLNLFGDAEFVEQVVSEQSDIEEAPETTLRLTLLGVVASSIVERGAAIIEYRNEQGTYGIGDKIENTNVTLDKIYNDRVIIKNRLTRETLMLDGVDYEEANRGRSGNQTTASRSNSAARNTSSRPNPATLREARQKLSQNPDSFMQMISLAPRRSGGQLIGYRVSPGADSALFIASGLKNGDVITRLNGLDLTDISQSQEVFKQLRTADSLQLDLLRDGEYQTLEIDLASTND